MAILNDPSVRYWRTDTGKLGREIYALLSNDETKSSPNDPLVGVMETSELAETVVDMHNRVLARFGNHYQRVLNSDD